MARKTQMKTATAILLPPSSPPPDRALSCRATDWGGLDPIVATIKGELRLRRVLELLAADRPDAIDEVLLGPGLPSDVVRFLRAMGPMLFRGENLPDFERGEVEIARIILRATRLMVTSVRAHRYRGGIMLRVVNDVGANLALPVGFSCFRGPLPFKKQIELIDNVRTAPADEPKPGIILEQLALRLAEGLPPERAAELVEVDSVYYPGLREACAARIRAWCASNAPTSAGSPS